MDEFRGSIFSNYRLLKSVSMTTTPRERAAWSDQTMTRGSESPSLKLNLLTTEQPRNGPKHPEFADQLQRFRTYPLEALRTSQRAESLAKAGFFYEGRKTSTGPVGNDIPILRLISLFSECKREAGKG